MCECLLYTNDYISASPPPFLHLCQLHVNGIVSVSSNRVHVYKICELDGPSCKFHLDDLKNVKGV